jgi:hypothetical protein
MEAELRKVPAQGDSPLRVRHVHHAGVAIGPLREHLIVPASVFDTSLFGNEKRSRAE